jgi:hypothetical protein
MKPRLQDGVSDQYGSVSLQAFALAASVFGASLFGMGRFVEQAHAQTVMETQIALTLPLADLHMTATARVEVETALQAMSDADLSLTYARIFATFRDYIGEDDLTVARALVDYAMLTEAALEARGIRRPSGTESARAMLTTYELVL